VDKKPKFLLFVYSAHKRLPNEVDLNWNISVRKDELV